MAAKHVLKLYVTGQTANSAKAIENLKDVLKNGLSELYKLKVIDAVKNPQLAEKDNILAAPTLVKSSPLPERRFIGDLSDKERVLTALGLTAEKESREVAQ